MSLAGRGAHTCKRVEARAGSALQAERAAPSRWRLLTVVVRGWWRPESDAARVEHGNDATLEAGARERGAVVVVQARLGAA